MLDALTCLRDDKTWNPRFLRRRRSRQLEPQHHHHCASRIQADTRSRTPSSRSRRSARRLQVSSTGRPSCSRTDSDLFQQRSLTAHRMDGWRRIRHEAEAKTCRCHGPRVEYQRVPLALDVSSFWNALPTKGHRRQIHAVARGRRRRGCGRSSRTAAIAVEDNSPHQTSGRSTDAVRHASRRTVDALLKVE